MERKQTRRWKQDKKDIGEAARVLRQGGLVAFPTETVYGLGADGFNPEAVQNIFAAKGRPPDNPLILHVCDGMMLDRVAVDIPEKAREIMDRFWPGPLTLVFRRSFRVPREVTAGLETVAVRMPSYQAALDLIREAGVPVAAPSANLSGRPSPTRGEHVLLDLDGRVDGVIMGEVSEVGVESTILDVSASPFTLLRPGAVTWEELEKIAGPVVPDPGFMGEMEGKPKAPGMKYRHYSPEANIVLLEGSDRERVQYLAGVASRQEKNTGVISTEQLYQLYLSSGNPPFSFWARWGPREDPARIARSLYHLLRLADEAGMKQVYVEAMEERGLAAAVMNRLRKAAGNEIIRCGKS